MKRPYTVSWINSSGMSYNASDEFYSLREAVEFAKAEIDKMRLRTGTQWKVYIKMPNGDTRNLIYNTDTRTRTAVKKELQEYLFPGSNIFSLEESTYLVF